MRRGNSRSGGKWMLKRQFFPVGLPPRPHHHHGGHHTAVGRRAEWCFGGFPPSTTTMSAVLCERAAINLGKSSGQGASDGGK
jgi:hypothetical protein